MGSRARPGLLLLSLLVVGGLSFLAPSVRAVGADVTIRMLGEAPIANADGQPIWVAGIWHEIFVNLTAATAGSVEVRASLPGGSPKTMDADYDWLYDAANATWTDAYYALFIRSDLSYTDGQHFVFVVGVDAAAIPGLWTVHIIAGGSTSVTETVVIQAPSLSYVVFATGVTCDSDPNATVDI